MFDIIFGFLVRLIREVIAILGSWAVCDQLIGDKQLKARAMRQVPRPLPFCLAGDDPFSKSRITDGQFFAVTNRL